MTKAAFRTEGSRPDQRLPGAGLGGGSASGHGGGIEHLQHVAGDVDARFQIDDRLGDAAENLIAIAAVDRIAIGDEPDLSAAIGHGVVAFRKELVLAARRTLLTTAALRTLRLSYPEAHLGLGIADANLSLLPAIFEQFQLLKNAQQGSADAEIISAFPMQDAQVTDLVAALQKKFGRKLNPTVTVDPSLIGGVRVVVGDEVLDTSVRAKLQQMQVALAS